MNNSIQHTTPTSKNKNNLCQIEANLTVLFLGLVSILTLFFFAAQSLHAQEPGSIEPDIYDLYYNDDSEDTINEISHGVIQVHNFHVVSDQDWIKVTTFNSGMEHSIDVNEVGEKCDPVIYIYENGLDSAPTARDLGSEGESEHINFTPSTAGIYWIRIANAAPDFTGATLEQVSYEVTILYPFASASPKIVLDQPPRIDDSQALNPDGQVNPGETVFLYITLRNEGGAAGFDVDGKLYSLSEGAQVDSDRSKQLYGDIAMGDTEENTAGYQITIPDTAQPGETLAFLLRSTWLKASVEGIRGIDAILIEIPIVEASGMEPTPTPIIEAPTDLAFAGHQITNDIFPGIPRSGDGVIQPGETVSIKIKLTNRSTLPVESVQAALQSDSGDIQISSNPLRWDRINAGETAESDNHIDAVILLSATPLSAIPVTVWITGPENFSLESEFELWILPSVNLGPESGNGIQPTGLAFVPDNSSLFVTNLVSDSISVTARKTVASIPTAPGPGPIVYDSETNLLYVGHHNAPILTIIDPLQYTVIQEIQFEGVESVDDLALASEYGLLFAAHEDIDQISQINLRNPSQQTRLTGFSSVASIAYLRSLSSLVVLDPNAAQLTLIQLPTYQRQIAPVQGQIHGNTFEVDNANGVLYFGGSLNGQEGIHRFSIVDGSTNFFILGRRVRGLTLDSLTNRLYVSVVESTGDEPNLAMLDAQTGAILQGAQSRRRFSTLLAARQGDTAILFAADPTEHRLVTFSLDSIEQVQNTITLGNTPSGAAADPAQGRVYVTNSETSLLSAVDSTSMRLLESLSVGSRPNDVVFDPSRNRAYVMLQGESAVLEIATGGALRSVRRYAVGVDPIQLGIDTQRNRIAVPCYLGNQVFLIDPEANTVQELDYINGPIGVVIDEAQGRFYIIAQGSMDIDIPSELIAFDTETGRILNRTEWDSINSPAAISFDPQTQRILVSIQNAREVWTFDTELNRMEEQTISIGDLIGTLAVDSTLRRLYVSTPNAGQLRVYNLDTFEFIRTIDAGRGPSGIAVEEKTGRVYTAARIGGVLSMYEDPNASVEPLPAPEALTANAADSEIQLNWQGVNGSEGYIVERARSNLSRFVPITSRPLTRDRMGYTDTDVINGLSYQYQVRAVDSNLRPGAPAVSDFVSPQSGAEPELIITPLIDHIRLVPGESGHFTISLHPQAGFDQPITYTITGDDQPRIESVDIQPGAPTISRLASNRDTPVLLRVQVFTTGAPTLFERIPLQLSVTAGSKTHIVPLTVEIVPIREDNTGQEDSRESQLRKLSTRTIPISLTLDQTIKTSAGASIRLSGEIAVPNTQSAIDLTVKKPNGETTAFPGVLVENSVFSLTIPIASQEEAGTWEIEAAFSGNDTAFSGQSARFLLPVEWENGDQSASTSTASVQPMTSNFGTGAFLAAVGPTSNFRSQSFSQTVLNRAQSIMKTRRYSENNIKLMSAAGEAASLENLTSANLQKLLEETAPLDTLVLHFIADVNNAGQLILNETETLAPSDFDNAITAVRGINPTILIVDGYRANAFVEKLGLTGRTLIASTGSGEMNAALFGEFADGTPLSFSNFFLDAINLGNSVEESFAIASDQIIALQGPFVVQIPRLHVGDEALAQWPVGVAEDAPLAPMMDRIPPVIVDLNPTQILESDQDELRLEVEVSDNRAVQSVSVILGETGGENEKTIQLTPGNKTGLFTGVITFSDLPPLQLDQESIPVAVIAIDTSGNLSEPVLTSILAGANLTWVDTWQEM